MDHVEEQALMSSFVSTSQCPSNRYGPQCTHECINLQRKTFCNYIGDTIDLYPYGADCVCEGNFLEPNCILCDENYYPPDLCNVQCIPQDNSFGHYTCDPQSGNIVCLEGYTDPLTFCVNNEGDETHRKFISFLLHNLFYHYNADWGSTATTVGAGSGASLAFLIVLSCFIGCCYFFSSSD